MSERCAPRSSWTYLHAVVGNQTTLTDAIRFISSSRPDYAGVTERRLNNSRLLAISRSRSQAVADGVESFDCAQRLRGKLRSRARCRRSRIRLMVGGSAMRSGSYECNLLVTPPGDPNH